MTLASKDCFLPSEVPILQFSEEGKVLFLSLSSSLQTFHRLEIIYCVQWFSTSPCFLWASAKHLSSTFSWFRLSQTNSLQIPRSFFPQCVEILYLFFYFWRQFMKNCYLSLNTQYNLPASPFHSGFLLLEKFKIYIFFFLFYLYLTVRFLSLSWVWNPLLVASLPPRCDMLQG